MNHPLKAFVTAAFILVCVASAYADSDANGAAGTGHGLQPMVLIGLAAMLLVAKLGGELFERLKQPAVLGELIGGIIIGNLVLFGFTAAEPLKTDAVI